MSANYYVIYTSNINSNYYTSGPRQSFSLPSFHGLVLLVVKVVQPVPRQTGMSSTRSPWNRWKPCEQWWSRDAMLKRWNRSPLPSPDPKLWSHLRLPALCRMVEVIVCLWLWFGLLKLFTSTAQRTPFGRILGKHEKTEKTYKVLQIELSISKLHHAPPKNVAKGTCVQRSCFLLWLRFLCHPGGSNGFQISDQKTTKCTKFIKSYI
jgi:hypothetical protein